MQNVSALYTNIYIYLYIIKLNEILLLRLEERPGAWSVLSLKALQN